ncbi:hypothetical protein [Thioalkalivibrio sp. ALMg9]|uniref:hypothetical protein n=1 Tax=Thioalkalivibrio sp. ALMg9 TaxID=1266912 RepID=UPI0012DDF055
MACRAGEAGAGGRRMPISVANRIRVSHGVGSGAFRCAQPHPTGQGLAAGVRIPSVLTFSSRMEPLAEGVMGREKALDV